MKITILKYQLAIDQPEKSSRFWVTLKDSQETTKQITIDCHESVQNVWKIPDRHELFRAIYPLLKKQIISEMNKTIRTVNQLPDFSFSAGNIPKFAPNENLTLPETFDLSGNKLDVFPFKPDSIVQTLLHEFEEKDLESEEQIKSLIHLMFEHSERKFYYFIGANKSPNKILKSAEQQNIILLNEVDSFYYKHPDHLKDYIKISGNNPKNEWEAERIKNGPEFKRYKLRLSQKAKLDLEINYKKAKENDNPFTCDLNIYGVGIKGDKVLPWIKKKMKHITKHFSGRR